MSQDLFVLGIPMGEKLLRTVVVYVFLLIGLRLAGKRELEGDADVLIDKGRAAGIAAHA